MAALVALAVYGNPLRMRISGVLMGCMRIDPRHNMHVQRPCAFNNKPKPTQARTLGLLIDDSELINSELYMQIQSGAQREARYLGYDIKMRWTHDREDLELEAQASAGLPVVGRHDADSLAKACATTTPIVRIGWLAPLDRVDLVGGTYHEAGSAVADHLLNLGHTDIAFVHGDSRYRGRMERLYGMRQKMEQHPNARLFDMTWDTDSTFARQFDAQLEGGIKPTAFFVPTMVSPSRWYLNSCLAGIAFQRVRQSLDLAISRQPSKFCPP